MKTSELNTTSGHVGGRRFNCITQTKEGARPVRFIWFLTPRFRGQDLRKSNLLVAAGENLDDIGAYAIGAQSGEKHGITTSQDLSPLYMGTTGILEEYHIGQIPRQLAIAEIVYAAKGNLPEGTAARTAAIRKLSKRFPKERWWALSEALAEGLDNYQADSVSEVSFKHVGESTYEFFTIEQGDCTRSLRLLEAHYGPMIAGVFYKLALRLESHGSYELPGFEKPERPVQYQAPRPQPSKPAQPSRRSLDRRKKA
jgi:hypothetical protein